MLRLPSTRQIRDADPGNRPEGGFGPSFASASGSCPAFGGEGDGRRGAGGLWPSVINPAKEVEMPLVLFLRINVDTASFGLFALFLL